MKIVKLALPLFLLALSATQAVADNALDCKTRTDAMNIMTDVIVIRPVGLAATLAGGVLFVGISPLTALASIPYPHDSFNKVSALLIGVPYGYTFVRPLGEFSNTCH